jgi:oligoendopeptidase F
MELKWNLDSLFIDDEQFYKEIEKVKLLLAGIQKIRIEDINSESLFEILNKVFKIKELTNNILIYGSLKYYKNINSDECIKLKDVAEKFNNEVNLSLKFIEEMILNYGKENILNLLKSNKELQIYHHYLDNLFRMQEHTQDKITNEKISDNNNCINEQIKKYNDMIRDISYGKIEIDGTTIEINSSNFAKLISSRDRETREKAYLEVNKNFAKEKEGFSNILTELIKYRKENASLEKYNSVLEKTLFSENIDSKILDSLINSVNNNLKLIQRYLKLKSDIIGIENPHLFDFNVPIDSNLKIKYSIEEAIEIIKNALLPLGTKYLEVVDYLLDGHIDAYPDENKHQSITFSWHTYSFMNFRGSYNDLKNMIHELGHIVNYYLSKNNLPFVYEDSTVFVGETASIINEILLNRYLSENAKTNEEKLFYLSKEIENYFTSVFKQTMYTEYENQLYTTDNLNAEILSQKYFDLIQKYYGSSIIYDKEASYEWTRLGHLYRWSYYPYKYATGLLIASNIVNSLIDEKTLSKDKYIEFLSLGSSMYSLELLKIVNVDLTNSDIISDGFKVLENDINEIEKVLVLKNIENN